MDPNTDTTADSRADPGPDVVFREVIAAPLPGTLLIDLDLGSLRVRTHDEPTVSLEASVSGWARDRMEFRVEHSGDELQLCGEIDEWTPGLLGGTRVRVYAVVPTSFGLDLHTGAGSVRVRGIGGSVAADTGAGIVEVDGAGGPVLVKTGGGAARVRNVDGDVRARTAGGLVDVRDVAGRVEARTLGGGIRVRGARGQVDARAAAGPISVSFVDRPSGSLETAAGPIDVRLARRCGVDLDARCTWGDVQIDPALAFQGSRRASSARGPLAGGGDRLRVRAAAGGIRLRQG